MDDGVSKVRIRRPGVKLSQALQQTLLNAGSESLRNYPEPPLERKDSTGDATLQARRRSLDAGDPDTLQPRVEERRT